MEKKITHCDEDKLSVKALPLMPYQKSFGLFQTNEKTGSSATKRVKYVFEIYLSEKTNKIIRIHNPGMFLVNGDSTTI